MSNDTEVVKNQGEIIMKLLKANSGKISLKDLGLSDEDLFFESGLIRLVLDLEATNGNRKFFSVPTIEVSYKENMGETHWICDYNDETILDKLDHHGKSTIMLLNRNKLEAVEHHHKNVMVLHAEFPGPVHVIAEDSYLHLFN